MKNWIIIAAVCVVVIVALIASTGFTNTKVRGTFQMALSGDGFVVAVMDTRSGETHVFDIKTGQENIVFAPGTTKVSGALGGN